MKKTFFILSTMCLLLSGGIGAQVTIGSAQKPITGALLDLKQEGTTTKGLGMPRVHLQDIDKLKMSATGTEYTDKAAHTGLAVYHVSGAANPKCTPIPDGLYVWDGGKWNGIGTPKPMYSTSLDVGTKAIFEFPSGKDARGAITSQNFTVRWSPANPLAYTNTAHATLGGLSFVGISLPISPLPASPITFNMMPDVMTVSSNAPWKAKETTLQFDVAGNECYPALSETITLKQMNYGLIVDGSARPREVRITSSVIGNSISIASNAQWKLSSIEPTSNSAVTSADLNIVKGTELKDGTAATNTVNYDVTVGANKSRYSYLTITNTDSPKRFNDVVVTIAQCDVSGDLTMEQYKNLWEEAYGLIAGVDEPNSSGNTSRNTNQVQWHRDQDNNIFFSSMFGAERWMITNLAAISYAAGSPIKPALTNTYTRNSSACWGYPNIGGNMDAGLTTEYAVRNRLGALYNWHAATGNQNPSTSDQANTVHGPHQGICPDSWYLPSNLEWNNLLAELKANPTKYSVNTTGASTGRTSRDMCDPSAFSGKSFEMLSGGFSMLHAGVAFDGKTSGYGNYAMFWASSSYYYPGSVGSPEVNNGAYTVNNFQNASDLHYGASGGRTSLHAVRCKK